MIKPQNLIAGASLILLCSQSAFAVDALWSVTEVKTTVATKIAASSVKQSVSLNQELMQKVLRTAPLENSGVPGVVINVPLSNGKSVDLELFESPIMAPELADKFPNIKTFKGFGVGDTSVSARFDFTEKGFRAVIFSDGETYYFDPASTANSSQYQRYARSEYIGKTAEKDFTCTVVNGKHQQENISPFQDAIVSSLAEKISAQKISVSGSVLHTYRLAVATTGEYTQFHGGTVNSGMAAVVTAVNRINEVYERELSVRYTLVGNNNQLIYTNASTDPYTNNDGYNMLAENQTAIDSVIGSGNYDIGHVFSTGGGGIAALQAPCSSVKAEGVTGNNAPVGDAFWVDYVAHEIGHQMGANHTFNGNVGSCSGGNRSASTAYEPGSASTIMGYAGICGSDNIANNSDDYFHAKSQQEVASFTSGFGSSCGTHSNTGNELPDVNAGSNYTIPQQTAFALTGVATDSDGDTLTYNWEQYNLGASSAPGIDTGSGPIFRSFPATTDPVRTFPALTTLINNTSPAKGSVLPSTNRTLTFRLTVRDGKGGVVNDDANATVTTNAGPFEVTSPNASLNWTGSTIQQVQWNVANTNNSPVNCDNVDILFSDDNGFTFPTVLLSVAPNDGNASVLVPNYDVNQARIKVACSDNIFFDMNDVSFTVTEGQNQEITNLNVSMVGVTGKWQNGKINIDVVVENASETVAHNPALVITLPEAVEYGEYVSEVASCEIDGVTLTCSLPDLQAAEQSTVTLTVLTSKTLTKFDFTAEVSSDELEVDLDDNSVTQKFGGALNVLLLGFLGLLVIRRRN
ncbi:hypothetical protein A9Q81_15820 [Gammaproteobacteria bacterium 42_54_T18]|nr:hypothetical protein A9Q81_15820 [Gammaproteobacteria bacterium 42_54_T18]